MKTISSVACHKILLSLRLGEMTMTEISRKTNLSRQTVHNYVAVLSELGLISERRERGIPPKRYIWLNANGKKAAYALHAIEAHRLTKTGSDLGPIRKMVRFMMASSF